MSPDRLAVDTDVASLLLRGRLPAHLERFILGYALQVTPITLGEAVKGAYQAGWNRGRLFDLLVCYEQVFGLVVWHAGIPTAYGMMAGLARRRGVTIGDNDMWISAWCVACQLPLMSMNRRHFEPLERFGLDLVP